jgi:sodium transport system permease protein
MTSPSEPRTPRLYHAGASSALPPATAIALLLAGIATYLVVGIALAQAGLSIFGVVLGGELTLLALTLFAVRRGDLRGAALGIRRPPAIALVAAVLIGLTAWYLNLWLVSLLPFDEGRMKALSSVVDDSGLLTTLLVVAVAPAVCEELLFRGAVQRALGTKLFPLGAIALTALLFSAYHMSLVQALPTFTLGLALGALSWRADSVVPAMLAHFLNNAMAILVSRRQPAVLASVFDTHPKVSLVGCAIATAAGLVLLDRSPS